MMVKVNFLWLLLIAGGLLAFLAVTYYRFARAREWLEFYRRVCEDMNFYFMRYDILRDMVSLSAPAAAMLGLESPVRNFSQRVKEEGSRPGLPLYPLDQCLRSYEKDRFIKVSRDGQPAHRLQLHAYIFRDSRNRARHVVGMMMDVTHQFHKEAKLTVKAEMDGLTRLHNSGTCRQFLERTIGTSGRALFILMDVDNFKSVNDTLGHQAGDLVLPVVANAMRKVMKGRGFLGRLGGDEFCCYIHLLEAEDDVDRLCDDLNRKVTEMCEEEKIAMRITLSIGAAILQGSMTYKDAYAKADKALYQSKERGRNTYTILS